MKTNLQFDFIVDKLSNQLTLRREFLANRKLVWNCYTKSELLDQWFAPKPMTTRTKTMDFREGGHWHYAMVAPDGTQYWGYTEYVTIKPTDYYTSLDAFSNDQGHINKDLPRAKWEVLFTEKNENTLVETLIQYNSLKDLETVVEMGMEQGMTMIFEKLDDLLATLKREK